MFKKMIVTLILLFATHNVIAATPYLGAGFGVGNKSGANIFGGYGAAFGTKKCKYYLGGELFLSSLGYSQWNHTNFGLSLSVLPGIYANNRTFVYTRFGALTFRNRNSPYGSGVLLGLGLESYIAPHWALRGEATHMTNLNAQQINLGLIYNFARFESFNLL